VLQQLKNLNLDRILDNDEAVAMSAYARGLAEEYDALGQPLPEWLEKSTTVLREEIARRTRASDFARLKEIETGLEALKTATEKKADLQKQLADLQRKLGMGVSTSSSSSAKPEK
jgi:hypothetical protein